MRRRSARLVGGLALVAAFLHPGSASGQGAEPAGHGSYTDVRIDGTTVVIVVNIDVIYALSDADGPPTPDSVSYVNGGFAAAQRFWNDAFTRVGGCPTLRLELNVEFETQEGSDADGHLVYPYADWKAGTLPDGRGLPTVQFPQLPPDTPGDVDVTDPYENASVANFPEWLLEDPWALAHELGHLFGLGDDYRDGEVIPGREGTLMGGTLGGDYVDRSIVDDIAAIARSAGYELPECSTWVGTIGATNRGAQCEGAEEGTITLTVIGTSVTGGFEASGSYTCDPGITTPTSGSATLSGTFEAARFVLSVDETQGFLAASVVCLVDQQVEIPVDGDTASAQFRLDAPSGDVYECDVALERAVASG